VQSKFRFGSVLLAVVSVGLVRVPGGVAQTTSVPATPTAQSCVLYENGDFSQDWVGWGTDYVKSTDLYPEGRVSIAATFAEAAPAWSQAVIANNGGVPFGAPQPGGKVLVVNASPDVSKRALYRSIEGLTPGTGYVLELQARRIVAPGSIQIRAGSSVLSQSVSALRVDTWTPLRLSFQPTSTSTTVSFVLSETTGAGFGADFALADFRLLSATGASVQLGCAPSLEVEVATPTFVRERAVVRASTGQVARQVRFMVVSGAAVSLGVAGRCLQRSGPVTGNRCVTDAGGLAQWTYQPQEVGREQIVAWVDANDNGVREGSEISKTVDLEVVDRVNYRATGDSFTSGQGIGKDRDLLGMCLQSPLAYPMQLTLPWYRGDKIARNATLGAEPNSLFSSPDFTFAACSGGTIKTISAEIKATSALTTLITVMAGRNGQDGGADAFRSFLGDCNILVLKSNCLSDPVKYRADKQAALRAIIEGTKDVSGGLRKALADARVAYPNAAIVLVGYPQIFPSDQFRNRSIWGCGSLYGYDPSRQEAIRGITSDYNALLRSTAAQVGVHFVDVEPLFDEGHQPCASKEDWIGGAPTLKKYKVVTVQVGIQNVPTLVAPDAKYHPNAAGHKAIESLIETFVNDQRARSSAVLSNGLPRNPVPTATLSRAAAFAPLVDTAAAGPASTVSELMFTSTGIDPTCWQGTLQRSTAVTVAGTGFASGSIVKARFDSISLAKQVATGTADAQGIATLSFTIPVVMPQPARLGLFGTNAQGGSNEASAIVSIGATQPTCTRSDTASASAGGAVSIDALSNDTAGSGVLLRSEVAVSETPVHGSVSVNPSTGVFTYVPELGYEGADVFSYRVCDQGNSCSEAEVAITVQLGCTISGTNADDVLQGTPGPDVICGGKGDDIVYGLGGNDTLIGGPGHDALYGGDGDDILIGDGGSDFLGGGTGSNRYVDPLETGEVIDDFGGNATPPVAKSQLTVQITSPRDGDVITQGQTVASNYTCASTGPVIVSCIGTNATGAALDTTSVGEHNLVVSAVTADGQRSQASASYLVAAPLAGSDANVVPTTECVTVNADGSLTAAFGYDNRGLSDVTIPVGPANTLTGGVALPSSVTSFPRPNLVPGNPGRTPQGQPVVLIDFPATGTATWTLQNTTASASIRTRRCTPSDQTAANGAIATDPLTGSVTITGNKNKITAPIYSAGNIAMSGNNNAATGGSEYVGNLSIGSNNNTVQPATQVPAGRATSVPKPSDYAPGTPEALAAGTAYTAIPTSGCVSGVWTPSPDVLLDGTTFYVPCDVALSGNNLTRQLHIAATGSITIGGKNLTLSSVVDQGPLLTAGTSISIGGSTNQFIGALTATTAAGIAGNSNTVTCTVIGRTLSISGTQNLISPCT
jgi:GDSL-like Lipase/Acylhydrolase family/Bacterial Ig domain/RTX calcium-binding nonapeptide repeat (4 copies)